ncbi:MAG: TetR/AcrR family transcriptional regulator [Acidimicrobiales bacterium]
MARKAETTKQRLTADRVLDGAMALADQIGIEAFTIRKLAEALETKPMSIYYHLASKEAIIDGMVDRVFAEIAKPPLDVAWDDAIRVRCDSALKALVRHPWAAPLMESRTNPGPETLSHHDAVLGCLAAAGFTTELTAHAYALIDSYVYGFALQLTNLPATGGVEMQELVEMMSVHLAPYPHLAGFTAAHVLQPGYDFAAEFGFGLNLILDGLSRASRS